MLKVAVSFHMTSDIDDWRVVWSFFYKKKDWNKIIIHSESTVTGFGPVAALPRSMLCVHMGNKKMKYLRIIKKLQRKLCTVKTTQQSREKKKERSAESLNCGRWPLSMLIWWSFIHSPVRWKNILNSQHHHHRGRVYDSGRVSNSKHYKRLIFSAEVYYTFDGRCRK